MSSARTGIYCGPGTRGTSGKENRCIPASAEWTKSVTYVTRLAGDHKEKAIQRSGTGSREKTGESLGAVTLSRVVRERRIH